jgi:hypothetical protein
LDLILAYALKDYKCQGKTYTHAIIDLRTPPGPLPDGNSAYVLLSRLTSLNGLLILRPFSIDVFQQQPLAQSLLDQSAKENGASFS